MVEEKIKKTLSGFLDARSVHQTHFDIRTFLAVEISDKAIKEITNLQETLTKKLKFVGKIIEPENLHITLKFFGEITPQEIEKIDEILKKVEFPEIKAKLGRTGIFTYNNQPKIIWVKIEGNLTKIQKIIDKQLEPLFKLEQKFMSHLTIARIKYVNDVKYALEYIKNIKLPKIEFEIKSIKLQSSKLTPIGPVYTTLKEYKSTNPIKS